MQLPFAKGTEKKEGAVVEPSGSSINGSATTNARNVIPHCVVLALLVLWAFAPAIHSNFVSYDDDAYVISNAHVKSGLSWENIEWAFAHGYASNWHPLTWISHMVDCQIFGLQPWGHHLTNVLLHLINTLLAFLVWRSLTGYVWRSFLVAAFFGLHPLHVESVAWIAERKDVLSTLFWLFTMWAYVCYVRQLKSPDKKPGTFYWLALVCFALGLLSKPMLVTLPFVLLLLDFWPLRRITFNHDKSGAFDAGQTSDIPCSATKLLLEKIPFFLLALISSVVTFFVQKQSGAVRSFTELSFSGRIENAFVAYCRYIGKLFYPVHLSIFYPHLKHLPLTTTLLAVAALCIITAMVFLKCFQRPALVTGWLWFLGTLVPVIGIVQVGSQALADRYTYIPYIGLFVMLLYGILPSKVSFSQPQRMALAIASTLLIIVCTVMTRIQVGYWHNTETLFRHALAVGPPHSMTLHTLGADLLKQGRLVEAKEYLQQAVSIRPDYVEAINDLGVIAAKEGRSQEAIDRYQKAMKLMPEYVQTHYNLGVELGKVGRVDESIEQYQQAIKLDPTEPDTHNNLGIELAAKGRIDEAIEQFQITVKLNPEILDAHFNLGSELNLRGRSEEAIPHFIEYLKQQPEDADAHFQLGVALATTGRREEAVREFQITLKLKPNYPDAEKNLQQLNGSAKP